MKKILVSALVVSTFFGASVASAYTVYFEFGSGIDFDLVDGFDLFTSNDIGNPLADLSLTIYDQGTTSGTGSSGATPQNYLGVVEAYDTTIATYGVTSSREHYNGDFAGWDTNFIPGTVLSISAAKAFSLTDIVLNSLSTSGKYEGPYSITTETISDGMVYTASAVPIPAAVWLLGAGLSGLVAMRRKNS